MSYPIFGDIAGKVVDAGFSGLSFLGRPLLWKDHKSRKIIKNISYIDDGSKYHKLDVWIPKDRQGSLPIVFYVHGGGFRSLSKDTHWLMSRMFSKAGFLVVNINYRLAPENPYPAAIEDVCAAYAWMLKHIGEYGGDTDKIVLSGESAGANLVATLAYLCKKESSLPASRAVLGHMPCAVIPACGIFAVTDCARFRRDLGVSLLESLVIRDSEKQYISKVDGKCELADPLQLFADSPDGEEWPPFFLPIGGADPLIDDSARLRKHLERCGAPVWMRIYPP